MTGVLGASRGEDALMMLSESTRAERKGKLSSSAALRPEPCCLFILSSWVISPRHIECHAECVSRLPPGVEVLHSVPCRVGHASTFFGCSLPTRKACLRQRWVGIWHGVAFLGCSGGNGWEGKPAARAVGACMCGIPW
ncbi:hypothetical protein VUR80DRAFT_138 [Thermomyces stellatus]